MESELREIRRCYLAAAHARQDLEAAIEKARDKGATWEQIGREMDVSRQAAAQRFGKKD